MNKLFIPEKIKVGFQERSGTYTGKLSYVTYYKKNKLMKEKSWRGWCHIPGETKYGRLMENSKTVDLTPMDFENVPTEGFVLNKKAGGYSSGWNHRQTYCRVYDPRGFEFEIDIPNLLFILQECNAYKGKGLEGEFVYAWDGANLALLPAHCQEYQESLKHTQMQFKSIGVKDLEPGCYYKKKDGETEFMYLGKFNYFDVDWNGNKKRVNKKHVFYNKDGRKDGRWDPMFVGMDGLSVFATRLTDTPADNYAEIMDKFNESKHSGVVSGLEAVKTTPSLPTDNKGRSYYYSRRNREEGKKRVGNYYFDNGDGTYRVCTVWSNQKLKKGKTYGYYIEDYDFTYTITSSKVVMVENGELVSKSRKYSDDNVYTHDDIKNMEFFSVSYLLGTKKIKLNA